MGVYINMEMPESCEDCPMAFSVNFGILCTPTHNIIGDSEISKKQGFCPLVPVPPNVINFDKPYSFTISWDGEQLKGNICGTAI